MRRPALVSPPFSSRPRRRLNCWLSVVAASAAIESGAVELMLFQTGDAWPLYRKLGAGQVPAEHRPIATPGGDGFRDYHTVIYPEAKAKSYCGGISVEGGGW